MCGGNTRLFDIVINTDSSQLSPILGQFCKNATDVVIETFPVEVNRRSTGIFGGFLSSVVFYPFNLFFPEVRTNHCTTSITIILIFNNGKIFRRKQEN